jgi:large subunit ribosomal protein L24
MSKWIKKDDTVVVTCGNGKGKIGVVLARQLDRVIVKGVNIRERHKKSKGGSQASLKFERPIHISNVRLCDAEGKPVTLKARVVEGVKELYYMSGQTEVVHRKV